MKKKFELKCGKVKGIKFHPTRQNLVVISLYIGEIQIWDFQAGQMICKLKEEKGLCVRSVDFHPSQSLVIAGGDDFVIRGWNFICLLYTSPSPRDLSTSRMPSSA